MHSLSTHVKESGVHQRPVTSFLSELGPDWVILVILLDSSGLLKRAWQEENHSKISAHLYLSTFRRIRIRFIWYEYQVTIFKNKIHLILRAGRI